MANTSTDTLLRLACQNALLGNVPPTLRAVSVSVEGHSIRFRATFDVGASDPDRELLSCAATEIIATFPSPFTIHEEYPTTPYPEKLDHLDHVAYVRSEPSPLPEPRAPSINIALSTDEALVLFELLARFDDDDKLKIRHRAEEHALTRLFAGLQRRSAEPFDPAYRTLLERSREKLCEQWGADE